MARGTGAVSEERIEKAIFSVRGRKVMLDADLAELYGVETKYLVRAVKRNNERFPGDFMFQLSKEEYENLRCQFGTSSGWGGRRYYPYVFTEQGVAMLSSVLASKRAIQVNIEIMRSFMKLRRMTAAYRELRKEIDRLEMKYDEKFRVVFNAIRQLITHSNGERRVIGFRPLDPEQEEN
jgi:hypothetical protein